MTPLIEQEEESQMVEQGTTIVIGPDGSSNEYITDNNSPEGSFFSIIQDLIEKEEEKRRQQEVAEKSIHYTSISFIAMTNALLNPFSPAWFKANTVLYIPLLLINDCMHSDQHSLIRIIKATTQLGTGIILGTSLRLIYEGLLV